MVCDRQFCDARQRRCPGLLLSIPWRSAEPHWALPERCPKTLERSIPDLLPSKRNWNRFGVPDDGLELLYLFANCQILNGKVERLSWDGPLPSESLPFARFAGLFALRFR